MGTHFCNVRITTNREDVRADTNRSVKIVVLTNTVIHFRNTVKQEICVKRADRHFPQKCAVRAMVYQGLNS